MIKKSGIDYTILRNGWYTENYTGSVPNAIKGGAFLGSAGEGKISSATREDYAEAAVTVLTGKDHKGKVYELAGDEAFTLNDLAHEVSKQTGKKILYRNMPEKEYAETLKSFGIPEGYASAIAGWDVATSKGSLFDNSHQLSKLIGRPTTPLSRAVKDVLASVG
jgi:NAD(P)H dehydrogenase (quinone)